MIIKDICDTTPTKKHKILRVMYTILNYVFCACNCVAVDQCAEKYKYLEFKELNYSIVLLNWYDIIRL